MAEKFLILGASSFYGSNFASLIEEKGGQAIRLSRPEWRLCDPMPDGDFDCVVNFVSRSLVAESWLEPAAWHAVNVIGSETLFGQMRDRRFKKFVHVSTPEVYGSTDGWVGEDYGGWRPSTPYAVSRAAGDYLLLAYQRTYGVPAVITRTANIYGPRQPAHRFIPLAFDTLRRGEKLLLHGGGHTLRSWIHVKDACAALYKVAKEGSIGRTYHISTHQEHSVLAVARKICRLLGKNEDMLGTQCDRLGKDHAYLLKSDALRNMGWRDTYTLDRGLAEYAKAS